MDSVLCNKETKTNRIRSRSECVNNAFSCHYSTKHIVSKWNESKAYMRKKKRNGEQILSISVSNVQNEIILCRYAHKETERERKGERVKMIHTFCHGYECVEKFESTFFKCLEKF